MNDNFVPGLELCRTFFRDVVKSLLDEFFPDLPYSAAILGSGSEVLGFDDAMSSDHHWGPRVMLFCTAEDVQQYAEDIRRVMADNLPYTYKGYSTHFSEPDPEDNNVQLLEFIDKGPVNHRITTDTIRDHQLGAARRSLLQPGP